MTAITVDQGTNVAPRIKLPTVGNSTPITIGLALSLAAAIVGFGFQAGSLSREINSITARLNNIENREDKNAKFAIDVATKLSRIETLLEGATASINRLEKTR